MDYRTETQPIFMNTEIGLKRVFQSITNGKNTGITLKDFEDLRNVGYNDLPFLQMLQEGFQKTDLNKDEVLSKDELDKMITGINKDGLTQEQLYTIAAQNNFNSKKQKEYIEAILSNFTKIDENNDGKVSKSELDKYFINKEMEDKKAELYAVKSSDFTTFYAESPKSENGSGESEVTVSEDVTYE